MRVKLFLDAKGTQQRLSNGAEETLATEVMVGISQVVLEI